MNVELETYQYFIEQINLYADLALGRNYKWKSTLEKIFPIDFLFSELTNENLLKGIIFILHFLIQFIKTFDQLFATWL